MCRRSLHHGASVLSGKSHSKRASSFYSQRNYAGLYRALSKVDDGIFQSGAHAVKAEIYEYGEQQAGCLIYAEGSSNFSGDG